MKDFYFPHAINAASDEKILKIRAKFGNAEAYGMWWMLLEHLARNDGKLNSPATDDPNTLSLSYGVPAEKWVQFIKHCTEVGLLKKEGMAMINSRMSEHLKIQKSYKEYGKQGAKKRWGSQETNVSPPNGLPNNPANSKRREEKRRYDKKEKGLDEKMPEIKKPVLSNEETEKQFYPLAVECSDVHYADKTMKQLHDLRHERREEIYRKMRVAINSAKHPATMPLAKKIFHEIAGAVNDFGAMEKNIDGKEIAKRREFHKEESGEDYVRSEIDGSNEVF